MHTNTHSLIQAVKAAEQDFEFYPTTDEIIRALVRDMKFNDGDFRNHQSRASFLDIGAGNGKVLKAVRDGEVGIHDLHAIEKSQILCQTLDPDILVVGTDFHEQSLLSKKVDVVFCNPPYREFEDWSEKIIRQSASATIYLVIPQRWERSVRIADAITFREAKFTKLGAFDFADAEDRQARAKVHLLRIDLQHGYLHEDDAFDRFFKEQFADLLGKFEKPEADAPRESVTRGNAKFSALVVGPSYPEALVALYDAEMANVQRNYQLVGELDVDLLQEFDISPNRILGCLKTRLSGLRTQYWNELFSHLSTVTDRLTSGSRNKLLATLNKHVQVDFTVSNICAVVGWVIKNANQYIDSQLLDTYELMVSKCNVKLYKSNQRTWDDGDWRYNQTTSKNTHFALDYRIVTHRIGGVMNGNYTYNSGLEERAATFLLDLLTIARNLGFHCETVASDLLGGRQSWVAGKNYEFYFTDKKGKVVPLYDVKAFKNGNMHLRLNKAFILALNVEHGRLKGWLNSGPEAAVEMNDPEAAAFFKSNLQLNTGSPFLLLAA